MDNKITSKFKEMYDNSWYVIEVVDEPIEIVIKKYQDLLDEEDIGKITTVRIFHGHDVNDYYNIKGRYRCPENLIFIAFPLDNLDIDKIGIFNTKMGDSFFDEIINYEERKKVLLA